MSDRPLVGLALCVVRGSKVLLHMRKGSHAADMWAFPGGHLEMWESWEECALRELKEEAGKIVVTTPKFWTAKNTFFQKDKKHYVVIFMLSHWKSGQATVEEPNKCECWEWFDWYDNMPSPLMPGIKMLVAEGADPWEFPELT